MKISLIVDDSRVIRKVSRQILESFGFSCEEAENGQAALEFCKKTRPELVLLDWNMPVMNGIDFVRALRQIPGGDMPIVTFCSTENSIASIQQALDAGANEYIMKPFDAEIIRGKLAMMGLLE